MPELLRAFRFRVKLRRSTAGASGVGTSASGAASVGASASLSVGASFSAGASLSAGAAVGGGASLGGSAGLGVGASLTAGASVNASASVGVGAAFGAGVGGGEMLGDGGFQECSGLEIEMDVQEYAEGGRNANVVRHVGRARYQPIVLKRGMLYAEAQANRELWHWIQGVLSGERPVARYDGVVEVMSSGDDVVARWEFERGLPARVRGPELNARTGEIAIEELHIAHEGLRLLE